MKRAIPTLTTLVLLFLAAPTASADSSDTTARDSTSSDDPSYFGRCDWNISDMSCKSVAPGGACNQKPNGVCVSHGPVDVDKPKKGLICSCQSRPAPEDDDDSAYDEAERFDPAD